MQILQIKNFSLNGLFSKIFGFFSKNSFWLIISLVVAIAMVEGIYFYSVFYFINSNNTDVSYNNVAFDQQGFDSLKEKINLRNRNFIQNESLTVINPFFPIISNSERGGNLNSSSSMPSVNND